MKHRKRNSKIKYEHAMIKGLRQFLENKLEPLPFIKSIIPGEISSIRGSSGKNLIVKFKYPTISGAKLSAYGNGAIQEVFITTNEQKKLKDSIEKLMEYKK